MLSLSGFELYSYWVPLTADCVCPFKTKAKKKPKNVHGHLWECLLM